MTGLEQETFFLTSRTLSYHKESVEEQDTRELQSAQGVHTRGIQASVFHSSSSMTRGDHGAKVTCVYNDSISGTWSFSRPSAHLDTDRS